MTAPVLDVTGLKMQFGGLIVFEGISFQTHQGEILGIIGPNGAGKTTLFNILSGIHVPTGGTIHLKG